MIHWLKTKLRIHRQRRRDRSARLCIRWAHKRQMRRDKRERLRVAVAEAAGEREGWLARFPTWRAG